MNHESDEPLIWDALKFAGLYDKVNSFEHNIYSNITNEFDSSGVYLSGGEMQKLAIARAYAKNSDILIFDEASSSLDPYAERDFFEKILQLGKNKIVIYVSHHMSATVNADYIYLFKNGQITEEGKHVDLMALKKYYHEMFTIQANKYNSSN